MLWFLLLPVFLGISVFNAQALSPIPMNCDFNNKATITGLYRYAVKGLSADSLERVEIPRPFATFPDDRRFALLFDKNEKAWLDQQENDDGPEWLHKENFLCAFTNPKLMAKYEVSYEITDKEEGNNDSLSMGKCRLLKLRDRASQEIVCTADLSTVQGRSSLGDFFSDQSGVPSVKCITADESQDLQKYQFGNTSSGWKQRRDTRTIHIVNANTVSNVAEKCQVSLNPIRFRPNMVVEGWKAWTEFDFIGKTLQVQTNNGTTVNLKVLSKTVRCDGVSIDPLDPESELNIPKLLTKHFPEYGPYLGIYAVIEDAGVLTNGDTISLVEGI